MYTWISKASNDLCVFFFSIVLRGVVGIKTTEGSYRVVDSRTDVAHAAEKPVVDEFDEEAPPREYSVNGSSYFLGSLGETCLAAFQRLHNCTTTCGIMQLNPLPLSFTNSNNHT